MTSRPHQVQVYRSPDRLWRWRRRAGNYKIVRSSEQGHKWRWYTIRKARRQNPGVELVVLPTEEV
jgi:hypothetical protein